MAERISCFVMCGGVGSRLWPLSREDYPKQFHDLVGHGSMLASTVLRLGARGAGDTPVYVIASERHADRVRSDIAGIELAGGHLIFEPIGRNTAAAVAVAALETIAVHGDGLVLTVPSDHEISTDEQFWETVERGVTSAQAGKLVVFGIWPDRPETGYGYIEVVGDGDVRDVARFVEKPGLKAAKAYIASGKFLWNAGIFLFRATTMRSAFRKHQVEMWVKTERALAAAFRDLSGTYLPLGLYSTIPSISIDYAIMEHASDIAMVPASFQWSDLGSWQSLLDISRTDAKGNVVAGDVIAIDCKHSYLRSQGRLLSVVGLRDIAIVATADATFVAPVAKSQDVRRIVEQLERSGRLEGKFTPAAGRVLLPGACRKRVAHWLFDETLPLWSTAGVDERHGGFHEALSFEAMPLMKPKRMRTMARQVCAFSMAKLRGWEGDADRLIAHGITFMEKGRTKRGGWARMLHVDGTVADACEDAFDHACVMLMLAYAHQAGNSDALRLGQETFAFLDSHLEDERLTGFLETSQGSGQRRRSNSHMHLLEAFLAWYAATGERSYLRRAAGIIDLFRSHFFDAENWTVGEYFDEAWKPARGEKGEWTEPGHHFEWASLLVDFAAESGQADLTTFARPYGGTSPPMVAYRFEDGRGADCVARHLAGFSGILQVDGYSAYPNLSKARAKTGSNETIQLAGCWAHLRRKFYDLHISGVSQAATDTIIAMTELWKLEDEVRGKDAESRAARRQEKSAAIVASLFELWEKELGKVSGKPKTAEAIRYALTRREALERFLTDGRIEIDSNIVERAIRPQTITRKNSLFAGSEGGGRTWATVATLLQTCKMNGVDPLDWLSQTLTRIAQGWPASEIEGLMPWKFKPDVIG